MVAVEFEAAVELLCMVEFVVVEFVPLRVLLSTSTLVVLFVALA